MIVEIINKVLMIIFILSSLNVLRHLFYFIRVLITTTIEEPKKYIISNHSLILLGISISYVISMIITGFTI